MTFVLLLISYSLSAASLIWSWTSEDSDVRYFRYQLNGEAADSWNIVDSSIKSVTLNREKLNDTLYVSSSIDGINWSKASSGAYSSSYLARSYEASIGISPYALEHIAYSGSRKPHTRTTAYGNSMSIGFLYNLDQYVGFGFDISSSWHKVNGFHEYRDLKTALRMRVSLFDISCLRSRFYLSIALGADSVWRDDSEFGCYPLFMYGISWACMLSENLSLSLDSNFAHTFQDGSNVFHFIPSISMAYHFGAIAE